MSASNAQRFLASGGDDRALALKMFWGKVLETYRNKTVFWDMGGRIMAMKGIDSGKSWQFPIIGDDPTPEYHTPGTELLGQAVSLSEGVITIDDILVSHYDVPLDQITLSHFDVIQPFAVKLGRALAINFDQKAANIAVQAARTAAVNGIHNGGNSVSRSGGTLATVYSNDSTGAGRFRTDAATLARLMDEDNVPESDRYMFISPYIRSILRHDTTIFSADYKNGVPNDMLRRVVAVLEGFNLVVTNHLPSTNVTTGPTKYQADFTYNNASGAGANAGQPAAVVLCGASEGSAGIGFVSAGGIRSYMAPDERRNTTFMKAQMMGGFGILSPWCAGEITVTS